MRPGIWEVFLIPYLCGFACQFIKFINHFFFRRGVRIKSFLELGGLPSAHSAASVSLATMMGLRYGIASPFFIVTLFLTLYIMGEAALVRGRTGLHAEVLDDILKNIPEGEKIKPDKPLRPIGHTPVEVIMGMLFGFFFSFALLGG